ITFSYSDLQGGQDSIVTNGNGTVTWGDGNIDVDPNFTDMENDDFSLAWGSECINAGDPSITDPDGSWSDMGAYTFDLNAMGPMSGNVIINEIMFDPDGSDSKREYFELYNHEELPVWMMGWSFVDGGTNVQTVNDPNVIAWPQDVSVFARDDDLEDNGGFTPDFVYGGFTFSNSGEELSLFNPAEFGTEIIDFVDFSDDTQFPLDAADNAGMELIDPALDNSEGSNWGASVDTEMLDYGSGTPGASNSTLYNRPVADAGADITATDDGDGWVLITLDGSGSDDPHYGDPDLLTYTWYEEYHVDIIFNNETGLYERDTVYTGTEIQTGAVAEVSLEAGEYSIILDVLDDDNLWSKDTVFVTIFPAPVNLVINEFMINTADLDDELGEYVEIINLGNESVDLRSYTLYGSEGESHFINDADPVLVEPQGYFILGVSDDWSEWTEIVSGADYVYPFMEFSMMDFETADEEGLDEFTDVIGLLSPFEQVIDEVMYSSDWDVVEEAEGISIELTHPTLDNSLEEAWL
ncbi:MAG TPA: hypothetical protein EYO24_05800, partial [Candidatus Marinimicrobia bacterium]|nr:hypothetical protein [Candidatus Neomarinimicrobiota bacterium]